MSGLTVEQLEQFDHDGYLVVEGVLGEADLAAIGQEYREILDRVTAGLVSQGRIPQPRGADLSELYIEAMHHIDDMYTLYQHLDICLPMVKELDHSHTMNTGSAVFRLLTNPRLLDIAESVIGPEIYSNPVQHTRIKPPARCLPDTVTDSNIAATTWHQDNGVINPEADDTDMLTVWVAVTDATVENGCLIVESGSHREDLTMHCPGTAASATTYIPEAIIDRIGSSPWRWGSGRGGVAPQADRACLPREPQRCHPLEFRPPLPTDRPAHRPFGLPRLHSPQRGPPRTGPHRPRRVGEPVVAGPGPHRQRGSPVAVQHQPATPSPAWRSSPEATGPAPRTRRADLGGQEGRSAANGDEPPDSGMRRRAVERPVSRHLVRQPARSA